MAQNSPISLEDKVIVITGASRGIGAAIAKASVQAGAKVILASRKQEGLDAVAAEISGAGGEAKAIACHTGKPEAVEALFAGAVEAFGKVDALVNNAATNPYFGPMLDISEAAWDKTFEVNTKGYFYCIRELVKHLNSRRASGSVVNVASVAGRGASPAQGVYGMTKAAVISMTQTLAAELGGAGIRINAIAPGLIETRFAAALTQNPTIADPIRRQTPLGRLGNPDDIAGAAVYLCSDAASFVTGEVLVVDGGLTISTVNAAG